MTISDQERAERSSAAMGTGDEASKFLGITLTSVGPGKAVAAMQVKEHHLKGHKICHGGFIFTLADTAFAHACNSYNTCVVAQQNSVNFLSPAKHGDKLLATATEVFCKGRSGIYDVVVRNDEGQDIALFRGNSRMIPGTHFSEDNS